MESPPWSQIAVTQVTPVLDLESRTGVKLLLPIWYHEFSVTTDIVPVVDLDSRQSKILRKKAH